MLMNMQEAFFIIIVYVRVWCALGARLALLSLFCSPQTMVLRSNNITRISNMNEHNAMMCACVAVVGREIIMDGISKMEIDIKI